MKPNLIDQICKIRLDCAVYYVPANTLWDAQMIVQLQLDSISGNIFRTYSWPNQNSDVAKQELLR